MNKKKFMKKLSKNIELIIAVIVIFSFAIFLIYTIEAKEYPVYRVDKDLQREVFKECMSLLPKGPEKTRYNDWSEVVSECRGHARRTANSCVKYCPWSEN